METRVGDHVLYELAQTMSANDGLSAAVALRKLARAGYGSLIEVENVSDWILLSIPGVGVGRLGAVRRLTRPDWEPPSPQAVRTVNRFLSAAQFALRFWSPETLESLIRDSKPTVSPARPYESRLAVDLFAKATRKALSYCHADELIQILWQVKNGHRRKGLKSLLVSGMQTESQENTRPAATMLDAQKAEPSLSSKARETDHFAYPRHERQGIVRHYRTARERGEVQNKEQWAQFNYSISAKTLLSYEREFPELGTET